MQKVCENKAVLQTDDYIIVMKMTNVDDNVWNENYRCERADHRVLTKQLNITFHSGTFICKLQDEQYDCIHVRDPVITVLQITTLRRIVRCSTHPAGLPD
jgi:hypothetical protein